MRCIAKTNRKKRIGSAITEAIVIMPVLMVMLYGLYHIWRVSIIASNTTVALRSEMMAHYVAVNSAQDLNRANWRYRRAGFSPDALFYKGIKMFPLVDVDDITILYGIPDQEPDVASNVYRVMRDVLVGDAAVTIDVKLPGQPFLHGGQEQQHLTMTGICAVNPWTLNERQFFGALSGWIENIKGAIQPKFDQDMMLIRNVQPLESLPRQD